MKTIIRYCCLLGVLAGILPEGVRGQNGENPLPPSKIPSTQWEVSAGGTAIRVSEPNGWGFGPSAFLSCVFSSRFGIEFGPTAILWSDGFYRFGGLSADLGAVYRIGYNPIRIDLSVGPSMLAGSDSDGTFLALGGGYLAGKISCWPGNREPDGSLHRLGFFARGSVHVWHTGDISPAATAGVAVRF